MCEKTKYNAIDCIEKIIKNRHTPVLWRADFGMIFLAVELHSAPPL